ncbi:MAG: VOC family protein [Gallionellaceae bacterium]|jgi:catechol 2,3-dioxygenase-like lactoylglutathione lyase family enzyme
MILGLHHASLLTGNLAKSRAFYEGVLGLIPDPQRPPMSFAGMWYSVAPNQQLHLMVLPNPEDGLQRPVHGGQDRHVAFVASDFVELEERLKRAEILFTLSQSGRKALFCRDPDQNALEFVMFSTAQ